ncbi:MAG: putative phosphotransferase [Dactylosporangium sp.]|jgi:aminoglycoside phosphotransferase (APT) family kinase protein|nr:putative phosphotransferase [Dactylosporangium sp.]
MSQSPPARLDLAAVGAFLVACGVPVEGELSARLIAGGRSNLTFAVADAHHRWVVRRPPTGGRTPSAHDVAREFRVARALEATDVPVARTVALCEDPSVIGAAFTVVEYVEGLTIRTQAELERVDDAAVKACVAGLVSALAVLHQVDHRSIGLESFGRPRGYAARQLRRWSGQWEIVSSQQSEHSDLAERLLRRLADSVPGQQRHSTIVHGDFRIDNTLLATDNPGIVRAIVDWELSTIGDPVADVAMMCAYRHTGLNLVLGTAAAWTSKRLPSVEALAGLYEAAGEIRLDHWEFYMGLAYYKLAVIAEGISHRYRAGATVGAGFDTAGDSVAAFLEAGLSHVTR